MGEGEKEFFEEYEESMKELISDLKSDGLLITNHTQEEINQIKKFIFTSNVVSHLYGNFNKTITTDSQTTQSNITKLKEIGWRTDTLGSQYMAIMCHMFQVFAERLKLHLVTLIDFDSLGLNNADKEHLGKAIYKLKSKYGGNKFVDYLDTKIRNAVAHYTYYFANGALHLCQGYFDPNPLTYQLSDFMKTTKQFNLIVEGFFIICIDDINPNGSLILD